MPASDPKVDRIGHAVKSLEMQLVKAQTTFLSASRDKRAAEATVNSTDDQTITEDEKRIIRKRIPRYDVEIALASTAITELENGLSILAESRKKNFDN